MVMKDSDCYLVSLNEFENEDALRFYGVLSHYDIGECEAKKLNNMMWYGVDTGSVGKCLNSRVNDSWVDDQSLNVVVDEGWENYTNLDYIKGWMRELGWIFADGMWIRERLYETDWYEGCDREVRKYEKDRKMGKHFDGLIGPDDVVIEW